MEMLALQDENILEHNVNVVYIKPWAKDWLRGQTLNFVLPQLKILIKRPK